MVYRYGYLYFGLLDLDSDLGIIERVSPDGTQRSILVMEAGAVSLPSPMTSLDVDDTHVFWTTSDTLRSRTLAGGAANTISNHFNYQITGIDQTFVYRLDHHRVRKDGSAFLEPAFHCNSWAFQEVLDGDVMYMSSPNSPSLYRMVK
jgi:hypothetical protein